MGGRRRGRFRRPPPRVPRRPDGEVSEDSVVVELASSTLPTSVTSAPEKWCSIWHWDFNIAYLHHS